MKLNKLVIENFSSVKEATLYLADKGLVSIEGINEDSAGSNSNGAGKSTIINAILWCNYGDCGKKVKSDSVVNKEVSKNCMVSSYWQEEDTEYRITRYRKHKTGKNSITVEINTADGWKDITKAGATNVQEQIDNILGQDILTFKASSFAQQQDALDVPAMTDKALKELLERTLPFEDLTEEFEKAKKKVTSLEVTKAHKQDVLNKLEWRIESTKEEAHATGKLIRDYREEAIKHNEIINGAISDNKRQIANLYKKKELYKDAVSELALLLDEIKSIPVTTLINETHLEAEIAEIKEEIEHPNINCSTCGQAVSSIETVIANLTSELNEKEERLADAVSKNKEAKDFQVRRTALEHKITTKRDGVRSAESIERQIGMLEDDISRLERNRKDPSVNPHTARLEELHKRFKGDKEHKERTLAELEQIEKDLEVFKAVKDTFSPNGVRYHMLENVAPRLTDATNKYLHTLTDGAIKVNWSTVTKTTTGEYKEKFRIDCKYDGVETEYASLSGGEARKVKLACFFGLQDVIASRATKNIELWCGDEIDHALDAAGIERLMSVLDTKAKEKSTILVISHNELRDWIPNFVIVRRKDKTSNISGYLNGR